MLPPELMRVFHELLLERALDLEERVGRGDLEAARVLVHQIGGTAGSYGQMPLTDRARELERALRAGRPDREALLAFARDCAHIARAGLTLG